jgi:hypothetical protein
MLEPLKNKLWNNDWLQCKSTILTLGAMADMFEQYAEKLSVEAGELRSKINREQRKTKRLNSLVTMTMVENMKLQNHMIHFLVQCLGSNTYPFYRAQGNRFCSQRCSYLKRHSHPWWLTLMTLINTIHSLDHMCLHTQAVISHIPIVGHYAHVKQVMLGCT